MIGEQEHEIIPAIRGWLAATSDIEIPLGPSREEARRRCRELLAAITSDGLSPGNIDVDDDLKDVLWATVEELEARQHGQATFEECDRFYRFLLALRPSTDPFDERDELLHRVAEIGWRSAPGGFEAVACARASIWMHGDEEHHKRVCKSADSLPLEVEAFGAKPQPAIAELHEICGRLTKMATLKPRLVASVASLLYSQLDRETWEVGLLDDSEFFKAVGALLISIAARGLAEWDLAESCHDLATTHFRRCALKSDLDHVETERLALQLERGHYHSVVEHGPKVIARLVVPRERIKGQIAYAWALLDLNRPKEVSAVLTPLLREPVIHSEPALHASVLTILGNALSYLGRDSDAAASFSAANAILARFNHPSQLASLTGAMGEHLLKEGRLQEAAALYSVARESYREAGQTHPTVYVTVLLAEVLMLLGNSERAEKELLAILPLIEKLELRREAIGAAALLRDMLANVQGEANKAQRLQDQLKKGPRR